MWQARLGVLLRAKDPTIEYHAYSYGYFSVLAFLIPPLRWLVVRRFRKQLQQIMHRRTDTSLSLVGHSFGTHIIAWSLLNTAAYLRPKVDTIILAGSVLRQHFPWADLLSTGDVRRVINECGINDNVLVLNQLCVLFTGMAGRFGLTGLTGTQTVNRYFRGGHSHYFENSTGETSDGFMERYWLPLLLEGKDADAVDERASPTALQGVVHTVLQNSEPLKLLLYAALAIAPVLFYRNLYLQAERERREAIAQRDAHLRTLEWAIDNSFSIPFDSARPDTLRQDAELVMEGILRRLDAMGFDGNFRLEGHMGDYCTDPSGALERPEARTCYSHGHSREYNIGLGERQAQSFRRMLILSGVTEDRITTVSYGEERPRYCYPSPMTTAGEKNRIAELNTRVEIELLPRGVEAGASGSVDQPCQPLSPSRQIDEPEHASKQVWLVP